MFITHDNAQFYAVAFGSSNRTLVAIGGWTGSWELWTLPFGDLSATWRTIAYDHRGAGATIAPVRSITPETMAQDVFAIMDAYGVEQCVLAAESSGAAMALLAAMQQPQRIQGLVLVDGLYYNPLTPEPDHFLLGLQQNYVATVARFVDNCVPEPNSEAIRRWGRQILMRAEAAAAIQLYQCVQGIDLRPRLHEITQRTLIMHGTQDRIVPVESSQWLATQLPHCQLRIFEGSGHVPTVTRPHDVAAAINDYFADLA
ncbi:MAG: alpha/beta hydrolase [Anaerolineae bacterium]